MDKLSAKSFQAVGDVLLAALPAIEKRLSGPGSISFRISCSVSTDAAPLAWAKMRSTTSGPAARPRFSSQKTTFDLPDIGPISISWLRPTIAAGTPE